VGGPLHVQDVEPGVVPKGAPVHAAKHASPARGGVGNLQTQQAAGDRYDNPPAVQVVGGVTYRPIWHFGTQTWDYVDDQGRSLYSTVVKAGVEPQVCRASADPVAAEAAFRSNMAFWAAVQATAATRRARELVDEAVAKLVKEQGPRLKELDQAIEDLRRSGFAEREAHRISWLEHQKQEILDAYDPSIPRSSRMPVPSGLFVLLPYETSVDPFSGPPSPAQVERAAYAKNKLLAPDIKPDRPLRTGKHSGVFFEHDAVRTSVGNAYAYDIETNYFQVGNDLERLARQGVTEIHIATGTHGDAIGGLDPEFKFLRQDARSIHETMQRHPGLRIIPYRMSDPLQAARFDALQALAAQDRLPGGATIAAFCFSEVRVADPNPTPAGPYATREFLNPRPTASSRLPGALALGAGALSVYDGLNDPSATIGGLKVVGGGAQVVGGTTYLLGMARDSLPAVRFGSRLAAAGGYITAPLGLVDVYRSMAQKFDPNVPPMSQADAGIQAVDDTLRLAAVFYAPAVLHALAFHYGVKPMAEKAAEIAAPGFIGGMSQAYGIPEHMLWRW